MARVIGIIVFAAGAVFTLQGVGVLEGSSMSNTTTWTVLGPIIALVGAGIAYRAGRTGDGPS
ncbi:MAG TPA: hypothetical protein VHW74_03225 [Mycobacteriales bacterium]|jgi:hypothetical protein|nr:hypothetical protein [Mycobacteriales bacterium]